jgi:hypothetical protein
MQLSKHRGGLAEAVGLISQKFGGEPDWLVRLRVKWFEQYKILPPETSELYIRHHISRSLMRTGFLRTSTAPAREASPQILNGLLKIQNIRPRFLWVKT